MGANDTASLAPDVTARESGTGASHASRLPSGKAPSHGTAITADGMAESTSTLRRAQAKAPEARELAQRLTPGTYGPRTIQGGFA
jgi:hypothetical protein